MTDKGKRGLTLVEVVLAIAVLAIIAAPLLTALSHGLETAKGSERRLAAHYAVQLRYEELRGLSYAELLAETIGSRPVAGGSLVTRVSLRDSGTADYYAITVSAHAEETAETALYQLEGVLYAAP